MATLLRGYERVNWVNEPPKVTPLNEENLNNMDSAIADLYDLLADYDSDNLEKNTIVEIQINGEPIAPDENRVVNLDLEHLDPIIVDPYQILDVVFPEVDSLPKTYLVEGLTGDHKVKWGQLSDPSAVASDITFTTANGYVTIEGTMVTNKTTDISVEFRLEAHTPEPVIS